MVKYSTDQVSRVFQALSDPTRRKILEKLANGQPRVLELAKPFKMSLPAISKHLKILETAGLIKRKKLGRENYFDVITKPIEDVDEWIQAYQIFWKNRLIALEKYLKRSKLRK